MKDQILVPYSNDRCTIDCDIYFTHKSCFVIGKSLVQYSIVHTFCRLFINFHLEIMIVIFRLHCENIIPFHTLCVQLLNYVNLNIAY
jgi:hypothetical protein